MKCMWKQCRRRGGGLWWWDRNAFITTHNCMNEVKANTNVKRARQQCAQLMSCSSWFYLSADSIYLFRLWNCNDGQHILYNDLQFGWLIWWTEWMWWLLSKQRSSASSTNNNGHAEHKLSTVIIFIHITILKFHNTVSTTTRIKIKIWAAWVQTYNVPHTYHSPVSTV